MADQPTAQFWLEHQKTGTIGGPQALEELLTPQQLKADFAGAEIISLIEAEIVLDEGTRHRGPSSIVRVTNTQLQKPPIARSSFRAPIK